MNFPTYKTFIVELKGGMNENVSSLELMAGELIDCKNYMMSESTYGGYTSIQGYERFDGIITPSKYISAVLTLESCNTEPVAGDVITTASGSVQVLGSSLVSGSYVLGTAEVVIEAILVSGSIVKGETASILAVPIGTVNRIDTLTGGNVDYHLGLDYARSAVVGVPGEGRILGIHIFMGVAYAFRKKVGSAVVGMWKEDAVTGWTEIDTSSDPIVYSSSSTFRFVNYNFYSTSSSLSMYWVDGVNKARVLNGTTVTTISNPGMDPNDKPTHIAAHNSYLFLAYVGGSLQYSSVDDPADWTFPGEIGLGREITNLIGGVKSSLIIYLEEGIKVLNGVNETDFSLETFSQRSGARPNTAQRMFGTIYAIDDRGLSSLAQTDQFGDFAANSISQKFKNTLLDTRHEITTSTVSRDLNQYRVFYDDRQGIFVSFEGAQLKGATFVEYNAPILLTAQGEGPDGRSLILCATDNEDGFVFKMDSGPSFDGIDIVCRMSTAYFHYNSPRNNKALKKATLEVRGETGQSFGLKVNFDYLEPETAGSNWYSGSVYSGGAVTSQWGLAVWGTFVWGQLATATNRVYIYLQGVGTNASYRVLSKEKYRPQHTIQNIISDYEVLSRRI